MNKKIFILLSFLFLTFTINLYSQTDRGIVKEGLIIHSKILNKDVRYTIYLPYDYETSSRSYPILYLLHGYTDNDIAWIQFGEANSIADKAISNGEIAPMIIAMPDGGVSWYVNSYNDSVRYEDFFFKEFIPYIESHYRILSEKGFRAIAGLSMGGYGSLVYSLKHPDMFSSCVAFSPAIFTDQEIIDMKGYWWNNVLGVVFNSDLNGKDRISKQWEDNDPFYLVKNEDLNKIKSVRFYIDCGDNDSLYKGNAAFHVLLRDLNIPHVYLMREGDHNWTYWRTGLLGGLKFISASFHRQ